MPPRVLVTRSPNQASDLSERLRAHGLEPILLPAIEIAEPTSFAALDSALSHLIAQDTQTFHWVIFTSANAAHAFGKRFAALRETGFSPPDKGTAGQADLAAQIIPKELKIAAIGAATARALRELGFELTLVPSQAVAESLTEALLPHALQHEGSPTRFLLVRAEEAREHLPETLRAAGAEVTIAPAYRTIVPVGSIEAIRKLFHPHDRAAHTLTASSSKGSVLSAEHPQTPVEAITFTSSSTARNLLALCEAASVTLPESALRISIGPITTQTLCNLGYPPHAEAPEATVSSLAATVASVLSRDSF